MPRRIAVALRWDVRLPAPFVLASARGRSADRVEDIARASGVPVIEDADAAETLAPLAAGELVPTEYWEIVAGILAMVARMERT